MTLKELIEELQKMPQDKEINIQSMEWDNYGMYYRYAYDQVTGIGETVGGVVYIK